MPQDKKRVYRQAMLAERRRLQKALETLDAGQTLDAADQPTDRDGVALTPDQMRERIADLERQLHIKASSAEA